MNRCNSCWPQKCAKAGSVQGQRTLKLCRERVALSAGYSIGDRTNAAGYGYLRHQGHVNATAFRLFWQTHLLSWERVFAAYRVRGTRQRMIQTCMRLSTMRTMCRSLNRGRKYPPHDSGAGKPGIYAASGRESLNADSNFFLNIFLAKG